MMRTQRLGREHDPELAAFLDGLGARLPHVLAYHYPFYRNMLEGCGVGSPLYLGAFRDGRLVGLLPGFIRESEGMAVYSSLPFFGPNSGVICAPGADEAAIHDALLGGIMDELTARGDVLSASFYTPFEHDTASHYRRLLPEALEVERFTQFIPIGEAPVWDNTKRRSIRAAQKAGVTVDTEPTEERMRTFYDIYVENCGQAGIPLKPRACVEALAAEARAGGRAKIYFALREDTVIAGLLVLWAGRTVSYYIPCTATEARTLQPGTLLIDRAVAEARAHGLTHWNFEGSPSRESGVYEFKRRWGAVEGTYSIFVHPFREKSVFKSLGAGTLAERFPWFYVYPFQKLDD
ncbi:MAG TPA: GNAT family N-acetyltransferase [Desulfovibrio sp.]|uniref:GNAT family N-acetyltransferase n=1 Tax=Desulfovibrio sp. TaxID=885 RepID=UPI002BDBAA56|nr:GNAT family N-acetyltransferase [Desulfovibrio sp.]HMM38434.1 GNAT family N-acetyltransferase [Desulfovibrio sp.]